MLGLHRRARPAPIRARRPDPADPGAGGRRRRPRARRRATLMAEAERHRSGARRGVRRGHRRPPSARGAAPVRVARLRRRRSPPTCARSSERPGRPAAPSRGFDFETRRRRCSTCPGSSRSPTGRSRRFEFRELPVGPSRHLVRFLAADGAPTPSRRSRSPSGAPEFDVLRHLEALGLPAVPGGGPRRVAGTRRRPSS